MEKYLTQTFAIPLHAGKPKSSTGLIPADARYEDEVFAGPIDWSKHQGLYQVADKFFYSKYRAMTHSTDIKQPVKWHFNNSQFDAVDWQTRLGGDIRTLYAARARQLREKYDYLIMAWSGGGDSHQALLSFLLNDIRLDEIMVAFPFTEADKHHKADPNATGAENFLSEWQLTMKPLLDAVRMRWPDIKITLADMKWAIELGSDPEQEILYSNTAMPAFFTGHGRWRAFESVWAQRATEHKNICTIFGVGSVHVERFDSWLATGFADQWCIWRSIVGASGPRKTEYFYWTPDMPEIVREQAHLMLDHFRRNPLDIGLLNWWTINAWDKCWVMKQKGDNGALRHMRRTVIYPDLPGRVYQVDKPRICHLNDDWNTWFRSNPHSKTFVDQHRWTINTAEAVIDPAFFLSANGQRLCAAPIYSAMYMIGRLPAVRNTHISRTLDLALA